MFHTYAKRTVATVILTTALYPAFAQNLRKGENSPYSRYGIGEQRNGANVSLRGMGTISSAYANDFSINTDNPASYATLKLTTYEAAGEGRVRTVHAGNEQYRTGIATLSYLNVGIPTGKYMGINLGLRPETNVFYDLSDTTVRPGIGNSVVSHKGTGSVNYAFMGVAGKYKGFSAGVNFGYMFGTINNNLYLVDLADTAKVVESAFLKTTRIGGIYWKAGAMYDAKLSEKMNLRLGATFTLSQDLDGKRNEYWLALSEFVDTAYSSGEVRNAITLPMSYSFGAQLAGTDKWLVGVDYTATNWSEFRSFGVKDSVADNTMKLSIGGAYTPDLTNLRNYASRITYRLGFTYGTDYIRLRNTDMDYFAITAGASLPFRRSTDRIHTAIEVGQRGTTANGLLRENFIRFSLGISLNDRWFIKRKYE